MPADEDVDIGGDDHVDICGDDPPISSYSPVEIEKDTAPGNSKCSSSSSSSSDSGSSSSGQWTISFLFFCADSFYCIICYEEISFGIIILVY